MEYRFYQGDGLVLISYSSSATDIYLRCRAEYDSAPGKAVHGLVNHTPNSDRTLASSSAPGIFSEPGKLTQVVVAPVSGTSGLKRGQCFAEVYITDGQGAIRQRVGANYIADGNGGISLGRFVDPGPGGGEGNFVVEALASDIAPVDLTWTLAATNAFRRIYGWVYYYDASADAASRITTVTLRLPFGSLPTGFAGAPSVHSWTGPTLSLSEEGISFVYNPRRGDGFGSANDNGTITLASTATNPIPFPLDVREDSGATILFDVASANANDRWTAYGIYEEWIVT